MLGAHRTVPDVESTYLGLVAEKTLGGGVK
jgi:hypothetical protein